MKVLQAMLCLALCAATVRAGLDEGKPLTSDMRAFDALTRIEAVAGLVPPVMAIHASNTVSMGETAGRHFAALTRPRKVEANVVGVGSMPRRTSGSVDASLPSDGRYSGCNALNATLPCDLGMPALAPLACSSLPRATGIGAVVAQEADPFVTECDIWDGGALGDLRNAALEAGKSGNDTGYRELGARYWDGVAIATERRRGLTAKPGDGASEIRGAKRSGR